MDWNAAIERNREALRRVLAALVAMAGLTLGESPPLRGRCPAGQRGVPGSTIDHPPLSAPPTAPPQGGRTLTLPRHLHRAILRLLRPAEAAARRLVIVAARDIVLPPPPPRFTRSLAGASHLSRPSFGPPASQGRILGRGRPQRGSSPVYGGVSSRFAEGEAVVPAARWKAGERRVGAPHRAPGREGAEGDAGGIAPTCPRRMALPLTDPLPRLVSRRLPARGIPRISLPGLTRPIRPPVRAPLSPEDAIDARRLLLRLKAVAEVLDDLPRHARRFARWRARNEAAIRDWQVGRAPQIKRFSALRPGRPPGQLAPGRWRTHDVQEVLADLHYFATEALAHPD